MIGPECARTAVRSLRHAALTACIIARLTAVVRCRYHGRRTDYGVCTALDNGGLVMLKIWGRRNSINVQKVLWCCAELDLPFERTDAGGQFGVNNTPEYRAMNPNGLVPTINYDGFILWESHAIVRYLSGVHGLGTLWPGTPRAFAEADRWMEWYDTTIWPDLRPVFWNLVRIAPEKRDAALVAASVQRLAENLGIAEAHLAKHRYLGGDQFTMGDIPMGVAAFRWFNLNLPAERPRHRHLEAWYQRILHRPAFQQHCAAPLT
jgi:glutathione S-transferase